MKRTTSLCPSAPAADYHRAHDRARRLVIGSLSLISLAAVGPLGGCASAPRAAVAMAPLALASQPAAPPKPLQRDHFGRDHLGGGLTEAALREILAAPVFLDEKARLGVLSVATGYRPDPDLPLAQVPAELSGALQESGLFEVATEMSTEWPADRGVGGLRELAARYRAEYLLLYRHRFVDRSYTNGWAAFYVTIIGALFVPANTIDVAGVLEATLFDVRTGTILFTVYERVEGKSGENVWQNDRKRRQLKEGLLAKAAEKLAEEVVSKSRRLASARPAKQDAPKAAAVSASGGAAPSP